MSEKYLPVETDTNTKEIQETIKDILVLDEFPDDKIVEISVKFEVVPRKLDIRISKK